MKRAATRTEIAPATDATVDRCLAAAAGDRDLARVCRQAKGPGPYSNNDVAWVQDGEGRWYEVYGEDRARRVVAHVAAGRSFAQALAAVAMHMPNYSPAR